MKKTDIKKLDSLVREIALERDDNKCQYCGQEGKLNVHHIVGRTDYALRWQLENLLTLCTGCHTFRNSSFHKDPLGTMEWFTDNYPERAAHINALKGQIIKHYYEVERERLDAERKRISK